MMINIEDVAELRIPIDTEALKNNRYRWHPYHAEKQIDRYACSITSLDGSDEPGINFEALYPYNQAHGTNYSEMIFNTPTIHARPYQYLLSNFDVGRSHYIKMMRAGYFPWHRDGDPSSARLIHTIHNCTPDKLIWILDDKVLRLENNRWYYINTSKKHCLFAFDESIFAVFNVASTKDNLTKFYKHLVIQ